MTECKDCVARWYCERTYLGQCEDGISYEEAEEEGE